MHSDTRKMGHLVDYFSRTTSLPHEYIEYYWPAGRHWHTSSSLFNPGWWLIHNLFTREMRGVKEEIFLRRLYFIPIARLSSKRRWNASQQDLNSQHLWDIQNVISPSKHHVPKKNKNKMKRVFLILSSFSSFFNVLPPHSAVTRSLTRSYNKKWISSKSEELLGMKSNTFRHQSGAWWAQPILLRMPQHVVNFFKVGITKLK